MGAIKAVSRMILACQDLQSPRSLISRISILQDLQSRRLLGIEPSVSDTKNAILPLGHRVLEADSRLQSLTVSRQSLAWRF